MKRISKHIAYSEATFSMTAIRNGLKNAPDAETIKRMELVAQMCFEPVRRHFNVPLYISSFYRSAEVNRLVGGSTTSQHCTGQAIDIDADVYGVATNTEIYEFIKKYLKFDQLIWEHTNEDGTPRWIHVSYVSERENRNEILKF